MLDSISIPDLGGGLERNRDRYEERLRLRARGLVRRHRKAIEAVAGALIERGSLTDREVAELMPPPRLRRPDPNWLAFQSLGTALTGEDEPVVTIRAP